MWDCAQRSIYVKNEKLLLMMRKNLVKFSTPFPPAENNYNLLICFSKRVKYIGLSHGRTSFNLSYQIVDAEERVDCGEK